MSDKFDMKVVIDAVTTPLLHARLSAARSYRERAALLRSLAESALRGAHVERSPLTGAAIVGQRIAPVEPDGATTMEDEGTVVSRLTTGPSPIGYAANSDGHDITALAEQFAGYLGADA